MSNAPYQYDYINRYNSSFSPSTVHAMCTAQYNLFYDLLLERAISVFKWKTPDYWAENYMLYTLFGNGYFVIFNSRTYGIIPQNCGLYGYSVMYQPTYAIVTNPAFIQTLYVELDINGVLVRLRPNYCGVHEIVNYYASMAALATESIDINLLNSHLSYLFVADNKAVAESMKKLYDKVAGGEPAVFTDKNIYDKQNNDFRFKFISNEIKSSFIVPELLDTLQTIFYLFDREIGIPNVNEKRERLIKSEVAASNSGTYTKIDMWYDEIQKCLSKAKKMFPTLNISCERRDEHERSLYNSNAILQRISGSI